MLIVIYVIPFNSLWIRTVIIISILKMRKLRMRKVRELSGMTQPEHSRAEISHWAYTTPNRGFFSFMLGVSQVVGILTASVGCW